MNASESIMTTQPLTYASSGGAATRRPKTALDWLLWGIYYFGWAAGGCVGGLLGATRFDEQLTGTAETAAYTGCAAAAVISAVVIAYFARRARPLHHTMIWVGAAGAAGSGYMAYVAYRDQGFLWELGVTIAAILGAAALAVTCGGAAALALNRRRRRSAS
jgi:hypothetical protein